MSQWWYYDFMHPDQAVAQCLVKGVLPYELHYIKDIVNTRIGMFHYKGIEKIKGLTSYIYETALMFMSNLCFYKSDALGGWVLCRYTYGSEYGLYFRPKTVNLTALNGTSIADGVPFEDIVLAKDNSMDIPPFLCINEYIMKIQKVENTIFKTLSIASLPLAMVGNKKMVNQLKPVMKKLFGDDPLIACDDTLTDMVKGFNVDVPVQPLDVYELKQKYRNECLSSLGIYSVEEKRERIVTQELVNQNDYTDFIYQDAKINRFNTFDELNRRDSSLGIEVVETYEVNVKESIEEEANKAKAIAKAEAEGGDNNGKNTEEHR